MRLTLIAAALVLVAAQPAWAGRPLQTEDAGVLERGQCEFESALAREGAGGERTHSGYVQLGCAVPGLPVDTQLAVAVGRATGGGARSAQLALNGKTALLPLRKSGAGLTLAYSVGAERQRTSDGADAAPDTGFRYTEAGARIVYTLARGPWFFHANLGAVRAVRERRTLATWSVAAERTSIGMVDLMAEVFGDDRDAAWLNAGARWRLNDDLSFDAAYGVQMDSTRARLATVGVKLVF